MNHETRTKAWSMLHTEMWQKLEIELKNIEYWEKQEFEETDEQLPQEECINEIKRWEFWWNIQQVNVDRWDDQLMWHHNSKREKFRVFKQTQ